MQSKRSQHQSGIRNAAFLSLALFALALTPDAELYPERNTGRNRFTQNQTGPNGIRGKSTNRRNNTGNAGKKTAKPTGVAYSMDVRVLLGDNRSIRGLINFRAPKKLFITHEMGGVKYNREVRVEEIHSLQMTRWKSRFLKRNREGRVYQFEVSEYVVKLKDGASLHTRAPIFPFLARFPVRNQNGRVYLYTFWIDLLKGDGSWYTKMPGIGEDGYRNDCFKDVVKKIEFFTDTEKTQTPAPEKTGNKDR